ncbi:hypothetical protein EXU57_16485 [Segetibacter sp. 3557_3]|uniref:hypothetical protein n=1 Tax=Segetibacter sp. 3557_3 TaxID=2547429 RepID=UPI0010590A30|nr:hypothetical protein [Segetibacter sp. 3557_3]TDH24077.1 hypothetical protein EXU57_16485 [Segetibacter sp. 3557_3]
MKSRYFSLLILLFLALNGCKKDGFGPLTDSRPEVPVTVANAYDYRPAPTVRASKAENKIVITLQVPASSGRTIKEVTKIASSTTANFTAIYSGTTVGTGTGNLWSATPIPVNAQTYTFTTTFDEWKTKTGTTAVPASDMLLSRDFYFQLTLDNDQVVIPTNIRVWVVD